MKSNNELSLTSVKVVTDIYKSFKIKCIDDGFSLQKLTNRALYLYNTDPEFRKLIGQTTLPVENRNL